MTRAQIIIFAKLPRPGLAKTRLIPALGTDGAARLAQRMLLHTIDQAMLAGAERLELCTTPAPEDMAWRSLELPSSIMLSDQGDGDLGARLARASARAVPQGPVLVIGTDCPALTGSLLQEAMDALRHHDAVMIPTFDGGYALLGFRRFHPLIFEDISWSTATVARETEARIQALAWTLQIFPRLHDIDEPDDLQWLPPSFT